MSSRAYARSAGAATAPSSDSARHPMMRRAIASGNLADLIRASDIGGATIALIDVLEDSTTRGLSYD
jgi:hypothetical protein